MSSLARRVGLALLDKISFMLQTRNQQSQDRIKQQSTQPSSMIKKILSYTPQHEDFYYEWSNYQANLSKESNQILERKPSIQRDTSLRLDGFEQVFYKLAKTPQNQNFHDSRSNDMTRDSQFSYSPANSKTNLSKKNKFSFDNSSDQDFQNISQFEVQQDASTNSEKEFLIIQNPRSKEKYTAKKSISKYQ
ncbi:UNKNOWN [Stylonychia lemnae]|uniref:Uncharacterized protein n=1 Tax=Stylonychia lemnae TaxID=5949 RepID=A0A078AKP1_STYLE|nr:UNKNOWN [Stylonychia lemnae]|eukprot:CDW82779.1 UNKNOWN [Stylonychia lemnae]